MNTPTNFQRRTVGRYELLSLLGEGGAANTYHARDLEDGSDLAVKELRLLKSSHSKQIELFERECAILRELDHPQIPTFIDNVVERRPETISLYLVQELVQGRSLQQWLDEGRRFTPAETVAIMQSCLAPLEYLHERNPPLFHRDIKPSNIIQRPDGSCVLVDFGAVREAILDDRSRGSSVVGTFGYMAPEQFQARAYPATDLYGLAATALHLLTGIEPGRFPLKRLKPEIEAHLRADPHLTAILDILLEPSPEDRYANASALINALDRWDETHGGDTDSDTLTPVVPLPNSGPAPRTGPSVAISPDAAVPDGDSEPPVAAPPALSSAPPADTPAYREPLASPGVPEPEDLSAPRLTVADLTEFARRESLPVPLAAQHGAATENGAAAIAEAPDIGAAASPLADASSAPGAAAAEPSRQQLAPDATGVRAPVVTEPAAFVEALAPGGLGAREASPVPGLCGLALLAYGASGAVSYNAGAFYVIGGVLLAYALALALMPRRPAGRSSRAASQGERTDVEVRRIVKRVGPIGRAEWIVDYAFEADDELHYTNRYRLPSAKAAKSVALDPGKVRARYVSHDPEDSVLVLQK